MIKKYTLLFVVQVLCFATLWSQGTYKVSVERTGSYESLPSDATKMEIDTSNTTFLDLPFTAKIGKESIKKLAFSPDFEFWGMAGVKTEDLSSIQYVIPYNVYALVFYSDLPRYPDSGIYYKTEGEEGERIFKMEWKNIPYFQDNATISFQAWLHEKDRSITYLIGDQKNASDSLINTKTFIGILNNTNEAGFGEESFFLTGDVYAPTLEKGLTYQDEPTALSRAPERGTKYTISYQKSSSTQNVKENIDVSIYPNPASSYVSVSMPHGERIQTVHILSKAGKRLSTVRDNFDRIDVSTLAAGAYILEVEGEENRSFEKIEIH